MGLLHGACIIHIILSAVLMSQAFIFQELIESVDNILGTRQSDILNGNLLPIFGGTFIIRDWSKINLDKVYSTYWDNQ